MATPEIRPIVRVITDPKALIMITITIFILLWIIEIFTGVLYFQRVNSKVTILKELKELNIENESALKLVDDEILELTNEIRNYKTKEIDLRLAFADYLGYEISNNDTAQLNRMAKEDLIQKYLYVDSSNKKLVSTIQKKTNQIEKLRKEKSPKKYLVAILIFTNLLFLFLYLRQKFRKR